MVMSFSLVAATKQTSSRWNLSQPEDLASFTKLETLSTIVSTP